MAILVPNDGEAQILNLLCNKAAVENMELRLFGSNTTPAETDTAATYTETAGGGYVKQTLAAGDWTVTGGGPSSAVCAQKTFTFTGAVTGSNVYGYYLVGATSGKLYGVERFSDGPYAIANNGDQIKLTVTLTLE